MIAWQRIGRPGESGEAAESRPGCETAGQASQGSPGESGKAAESRPRSETAGKASQDMIKTGQLL